MVGRTFSLALFLAGATNALAGALHVPSDYSAIQDAIDAALPGDKVIVHPGIYTEFDISFAGKAIEVSGIDPDDPAVVSATRVDALRQGVCFRFDSAESGASVLRGLTVTGAAWSLASVAGGGVYINGSAPTIDRCTAEGNRGSGVRCEDASPRLTGLVVQNNEARFGAGICCRNSSPSIEDCIIASNTIRGYGGGGGLYCGEQSSPSLSNCSIIDNSFVYYLLDGGPGGGLYCDDSSPRIYDCWIAGNETADGNGGGIACGNGSNPILDGCTIATNQAATGIDGGAGGGVYCELSAPSFYDCEISGNLCAHEFYLLGRGGGVRCYQADANFIECRIAGNVAFGGGSGGGISCEFSSPRIEDCVVRRNEVRYGSGGAGLDCQSASPDVIRCTIDSNFVSSDDGTGGIECVNSSPTISGCSISANRGSWDGPGGVHCVDSSPSFLNCLITGNTQDFQYFEGAAGVACSGTSFPTLTNCTIANNAHPSPDEVGGIDIGPSGLVTLTGCIVWGNTPADISGPSTVSYSLVSGGWPGVGNLDEDPLFRDPSSEDYRLQTLACAGSGESPAIDAADSLIADAIVVCDAGLGGSRADMGAYGGQSNWQRLSAVTIEISNYDSTIVQGDTLDWSFTVANNRPAAHSASGWIDAFKPDASPYEGNPIARDSLLIAGLSSVEYTRSRRVPIKAPPGSPYRICVRAGEHPSEIWTESCVEFEVLSIAAPRPEKRRGRPAYRGSERPR